MATSAIAAASAASSGDRPPLLGSREQHDAVRVVEPCSADGIHFVERDLGHESLMERALVLDAGMGRPSRNASVYCSANARDGRLSRLSYRRSIARSRLVLPRSSSAAVKPKRATRADSESTAFNPSSMLFSSTAADSEYKTLARIGRLVCEDADTNGASGSRAIS